MKRIVYSALTTIITIVSPVVLKAQNATEGKVKFMKTENSAAIAEFSYPEEIVKAALTEKFEQSGLGKQRKQEGYMAYKGVTWNEISTDKLDVYAKVDGRKNRTTIYLLAAKGYDNFISGSSDAATMEKMKSFLNDFNQDIARYQHQLDVAKKEAEMQKAEKAYADHVKKQKKLEEDRAKLSEELDKLKKE
jgi:hypothetical protein